MGGTRCERAVALQSASRITWKLARRVASRRVFLFFGLSTMRWDCRSEKIQAGRGIRSDCDNTAVLRDRVLRSKMKINVY